MSNKMNAANKKLSIIYIWEILKKFSDEAHPLTQAGIINKLYSIYGMEAERKSVAESINSLSDFGCEIVKRDGGGFYLNAREFDNAEIAYLIDAVFASRNISGKHAKDLAERLGNLRSVHEQKRFRYIHKSDELSRTVNKDFFINVDIINEAIDKLKKIEFQYNLYDADKKLKPRSDKPYIINPYFMLNSNGKYYLVCNREGLPDISNYRLDYMTDVKVSDSDVTPVTRLKGYEKGIDVARYANENVYMFGDKAVTATLKLAGERAVGNALDWFGKNARIYARNGQSYADITASEMAVVYWSLQYGEGAEVIAPGATREKVGKLASEIAGKYSTK